MPGKTLIGGTAYTISGGKARVDGVSYYLSGGKTRVGGTTYDISLQKPLSIVDLFEHIYTSAIAVGGANDDTSTSTIQISYSPSSGSVISWYAFVFCNGNLFISKVKWSGSGNPSVSVLNQAQSNDQYAVAKASYSSWDASLTIRASRPVVGGYLTKMKGTIFVCRFNEYSEEEVDSVLANMTITPIAFVGESSSTRPATMSISPGGVVLTSTNIIAIGDKFALNGRPSSGTSNTIYSNNTSNPRMYICTAPSSPASASLDGSSATSVYNGNWFHISE